MTGRNAATASAAGPEPVSTGGEAAGEAPVGAPAHDAGVPDVAVIIPAWSAAATLERAVESALAQRDIAVEVVVVDDCSPDDTIAVAEALAARDPRVHAHRQAANAGPAAARNAAIAASRAPWICPLDSDDFMEPGRLAALLALARDGTWDFAADDLLKVDETDIAGPRSRLFAREEIGTLTLDLAGFVRGNLSSKHGGRGELGFIKPLMRRRFLEAHGLRYDESMRLGEDYDLYARALMAGARFCLTDPLGYVAVVRAASLSGRHGTRELAALVEADRRLLGAPALAEADRAVLNAHLIETMKRWSWMRLIDAVKARDLGEALRCFAVPLPVQGALLWRLGEQAWLRGGRLLGRLAGRPAP